MSQQSGKNEPRLDKPGAGLPFLEWAVAKYILIPQRFRSVTPEVALEQFSEETRKILELIKPLTVEQLSERRLIPRLRGLEDSSRYWSIAMTLDHLIIVGERMKSVIVRLSQGQSSDVVTSIADVKPPADVDAATIAARFEEMSRSFVETVESCDVNKFPDVKQAHPWFGPLNARQWVLFGAPHQQIHRNQVLEIIKRL